jgi:hypothetical protein
VVHAESGALPIAPGQTAAIPVEGAVDVDAAGHAVVFRGWPPDLAAEIVAPARAAGAADAAIAALSSPRDDVRQAMAGTARPRCVEGER